VGRWKEINDRHKAWIDEFKTLDDFKKWVSSSPLDQGTNGHASAEPKDKSQGEDKDADGDQGEGEGEDKIETDEG
jgi:hypothetical protein